MFELIQGFPAQLLRAIEIGEKAVFTAKFNSAIKNIVISGLGGSGVGGNILSELAGRELKIPLIVNKGYSLPAFVDSSTLLILCSYSGNTEETLSCASQAAKKGLHAVCITSGGKLEDFALKHNFDTVRIPPGFPPRSCLGYALTQLFFVLRHYGLIGDQFKSSLIQSASFLEMEQKKIMEDAEFLAVKLVKKVVILYVDEQNESIALRIKQQVNENGKMHCWYNVIPEMNHNELVGWREPNPDLAVVMLRSGMEYKRNTSRILFVQSVIAGLTENMYEIDAKGGTTFEKYFFLIHFGDWMTYHLALLQGFDPMEIEVLNKLKSHMATIN